MNNTNLYITIFHTPKKLQNDDNHELFAYHFNIPTNKEYGMPESSTHRFSQDNVFQQHGRTLLQIPR
jgi:hypothetical protein